jgi:hypothetical protein
MHRILAALQPPDEQGALLALQVEVRPSQVDRFRQAQSVTRVDGRPGGLSSCLSVSDACIDTISENHIVERDFYAKSTVPLMIAFLVPCRQ